MKKRLKWIALGVVSLALVIPLICLLVFISKTMDAGDAKQYCIKNTEVDAASFYPTRYDVFEGENPPEYAFWVAEDGLSKRQELFIFRLVQFGPFRRTQIWDRLRFAYHALSGEGEVVGSVMFTPRNPEGQKEATNWMVFYSSNQYRISTSVITVEENGTLCTREGSFATRQPFVAVLPDLGEKDGVSRKFVKAEFFDAYGNLVDTIVGNTKNEGTLE